MTENKTPNPTPAKTKKPKWLKALEKQSWQAELLISGIIIVNLFGLPEQVIEYAAAYVIQSSPESSFFYDLIVFYLLAVVYFLISIFIYHFGLRVLWIALLGLNSVFPKGIKRVEYSTFSLSMVDRVIKEFPDLSAYNKELDRQGSLMFSIAAMVTMILLSITFVLFLFFLGFSGMSKLFPSIKEHAFLIGAIFYAMILLPALLPAILKKIPSFDKDKLENWQYNFSRYFSKGLYLFFYKPVNYITNILMSNGTQKKHGFVRGMVLSILVGGFMGIFIYSHQKSLEVFKNFNAEKYMTFNNRPNVYLRDNYETTFTNQLPFYTPIIPSDIIIGSQLKLFIPTINREIETLPSIAGDSFWEKLMNKESRSATAKAKRRALKLQQNKNLNQIYINDSLYNNVTTRFYTHPHALEEGVLMYIPTDNFNIGENILEVRKDYYYQDTLQKIVRIPFFFEGRYN